MRRQLENSGSRKYLTHRSVSVRVESEYMYSSFWSGHTNKHTHTSIQ